MEAEQEKRAEHEDDLDINKILVARAIDGDRRALLALHDALQPVIIGACLRAGFSDAALNDLGQEVWRCLWRDDWRALRLWTGAGALEAYVARIARNKALDLHRALRRRRETALTRRHFSVPGEATLRAGVAMPDAITSFWRVSEAEAEDVMRERLEAALQALSPLDRTIITLRYHEACSYSELAERLDRKLSYVGATLKRALARLKRALSSYDRNAGQGRRPARAT